jgi:hypothetical protein
MLCEKEKICDEIAEERKCLRAKLRYHKPY